MGMGRYSDNVIFFVSQGGLRAACFSCEKSRQKNIVQNFVLPLVCMCCRVAVFMGRELSVPRRQTGRRSGVVRRLLVFCRIFEKRIHFYLDREEADWYTSSTSKRE